MGLVATNRTHRFVLRKRAYVRLLPKLPSGEAFVGARYEFTVGKRTAKGFIDRTGIIVQRVPVKARKAELRIWEADAPNNEPHEWNILIGDFPPITEVRGVQMRLENLGFDCGDEDGVEGPVTRAAVRAFEEWIGLKSAPKELEDGGEITREAPITDKMRTKLAEYADKRGPGLDHGASFVGDDERPDVGQKAEPPEEDP